MLTLKRPLFPPDDSQHRGPSVGNDVIAVKRAIARAGFWKWQEFDNVYSDGFAHGGAYGRGVKGFQTRMFGEMSSKVTGAIGQPTLTALSEYRISAGLPNAGDYAFDTTATNLYRGYVVTTLAEIAMKGYWTFAQDLISHEPVVHYSQQRPSMPLFRHQNPPVYPMYLDCSDSVTYLAWLSSESSLSPDPVFGFSGYGNTGSLIQGGFEISMRDIDLWAKNHLILNFYRNSDHVIAVKSKTQAFSHGREGGPEWCNPQTYRTDDYVQTNVYKIV